MHKNPQKVGSFDRTPIFCGVCSEQRDGSFQNQIWTMYKNCMNVCRCWYQIHTFCLCKNTFMFSIHRSVSLPGTVCWTPIYHSHSHAMAIVTLRHLMDRASPRLVCKLFSASGYSFEKRSFVELRFCTCDTSWMWFIVHGELWLWYPTAPLVLLWGWDDGDHSILELMDQCWHEGLASSEIHFVSSPWQVFYLWL